MNSTPKSTCSIINGCDTTIQYTGISAWYNRFLSCHVCTGSRYVSIYLASRTNADTDFKITNTVQDKATIQCLTPTANAATETAPTTVANCLIYAWVLNVAAVPDKRKGCIVFKPGYKYTQATAGNLYTGTCAVITDCDTTKNSQAGAYTFCTQTTGSGSAWKAFKDYTATECVAVKSDNCLFAAAAADADSKYKCRVCRNGYSLNQDKICEKVVLPQCVDDSGATNLLPLPASTATIIEVSEYYAVKYLAGGKSISGCDTCSSGFIGFVLPNTEKQCVASPYAQANVFFADPVKYVTDCSKYSKSSLNPDNIPAATFSVCKNNKIPTIDGSMCVATISNCINAKNVPNTSKCGVCATTHVQIAGTCILKNIVNCKTFDETNSVSELLCTGCNDGFVLAANKKFCYSGLVIGCKSYDIDLPWNCNSCLSGYGLIRTANSRTHCFKINDSSNCKVIDVSSNGLQGSIYKCTTCSSDNSAAYVPIAYPTGDNTKVQSVCLALNLVDKCVDYNTASPTVSENSLLCTECSAGFWIDETKNICFARLNQPASCTVYEKNKDKCKTCSSLTFINDTSTDCISFPNGILRCATYINETVCTSCNAPAYLNRNTCPLSTVIKKCATYSANYTCTSCESGYFPTNFNQCDLAKASNCLTYTSINACEKCNPLDINKGLKTDTNGVTSCVDKNVANCDISTNEFPFRCTVCKKDFFIGIDGTCSATTAINKCLFYDTSSTCTQCKQGYVLAVDRKSCTDTLYSAYNDVNCLDSQLLGTPVCSKCSTGSVFVNNACTSCINKTYADGCFTCDPANQATCFVCRPGYFQNQIGNCLLVIDNGTVTPVSTSAIIFKNSFLFAVLIFLTFWPINNSSLIL
jgi:hypothetical protein